MGKAVAIDGAGVKAADGATPVGRGAVVGAGAALGWGAVVGVAAGLQAATSKIKITNSDRRFNMFLQ